jgi:hypothetical protein
MTASTPAKVGETADSFTPLSVEEAQALMSEALTGLDRDTLLAERAEAEAQVRAAQATLGIEPPAPNGDGPPEQEPDEAVQNTLGVDAPNGASTLDIAALRRAAAAARIADDALARAASEAAGRPPSGEAQLGAAESAFARVLEIQEDLPAAWRRLVGALISATGMAIVVGALGWNTYWLLVPIALIAILTVDLRLSGRAAREASAQATQELATVGLEGVRALDLIREQRTHVDEAEVRLAAARAERDAAYATFEELAPGRLPSEVEEIVAEHEAEQAARAEAMAAAQAAARAEAEAAADVEAEPEVEVEIEPQADPEVIVPEPEVEAPATATQWWFGSPEAPAPPPAASAPVRALAERLSAEGREALKRIEAQLAALERVELAKKSLEWHEANGSAEPAATDSPPAKS